jgi:hypothetical protein
LVVGISTVADARPAADAVAGETPVGCSAKPTMTVSDGWKPLAASSMSSPTPRVSLAVEAMFFGGNSLIVVAAGAVFVVVVAAAVEVVADVPAEVVDVVAVVDGGVVVEELDVVVDVDVVDDELDVVVDDELGDVVVDDELDVVDDVPDDGAVGVPLTAFDATESPMAFMALIVTE